MKKKKKNKLEDRLDGIDGNSNTILPPKEDENGNEPSKFDPGTQVPVPKVKEDNRLMRETENGMELYARIVQLPRNKKRYVIVCPYIDGFSPGRMVLPKRGRERKSFVKTDDGWKEVTIPGKFAKRGAKFWVRQVSEEEGLYEYIK